MTDEYDFSTNKAQLMDLKEMVGRKVSSVLKTSFDHIVVCFEDDTYIVFSGDELDVVNHRPNHNDAVEWGLISLEEYTRLSNLRRQRVLAADEQRERALLERLKAKYEGDAKC